MLKAMANLDRIDLADFGLFRPGTEWQYASGSVDYEWNRFREDPCAYIINATEDDAERIFMAIIAKAKV